MKDVMNKHLFVMHVVDVLLLGVEEEIVWVATISLKRSIMRTATNKKLLPLYYFFAIS
jgi:hypothetical protein